MEDPPKYSYCSNCNQKKAELVGKFPNEKKPYKFICRNCLVPFSSDTSNPSQYDDEIEALIGIGGPFNLPYG